MTDRLSDFESRRLDREVAQDLKIRQLKAEIQRLTEEVERLNALLKKMGADPTYVQSRIEQADTYRAQAAHSKLKADSLEKDLASAREVMEKIVSKCNPKHQAVRFFRELAATWLKEHGG